jgi:large repetitive protein
VLYEPQRGQAIVAYLSGLGLSSKAVATGDAFLAEMRCGSYSTYWISGGALKLDTQAITELREAVYRGEALWMDGVHDSRNQLLHSVAGVKELGKLPTSNQAAIMATDGVYGQQVLPTLGQPGKFELITGQTQGVFTQIPGEQAPVPAVVSNAYGQGRSLLFAFDLAAMISANGASAQNQLGAVVTTSASQTASGSPTLTIGDLTLLATSVTNQGTRTVVFRAEATVPAGLTITAVAPEGTVSTDASGSSTVTWVFSLSAGSTRELGLQLRALQPGSYAVPLVIHSMPAPGSTLPPRVRYSGTFPLEVKDAASMLHQALAQVMALQAISSSDKSNRTKAMDAASQALALHNQGSYEQALAQWTAAADALTGITSVDNAAARAAISLAMEATTDALCIQRCGSAVCQ